MTKRFRLWADDSELGIYEGADKAAVALAHARALGFPDVATFAAAAGQTESAFLADLTVDEVGMIFVTPPDIAEAARLDDVDAAALRIQDLAGITDGGVAGLYLKPDAWECAAFGPRVRMLCDWLAAESVLDADGKSAAAVRADLGAQYKGLVGYDPFEDDPAIGVDEVRDLLRGGRILEATGGDEAALGAEATETAQLVTILKAGVPVFDFVVRADPGRAGFLAGQVMDSLADYHGGNDWDYAVRSGPVVAAGDFRDLVRLALSKVAF